MRIAGVPGGARFSERAGSRLRIDGLRIAGLMCLPILVGCSTAATPPSEDKKDTLEPRVLLLPPGQVQERPAVYAAQGFDALAITIDDETPGEWIDDVALWTRRDGLRLYLWINVGRNPRLADRHPEWIAGMGAHDDWRRFRHEPPTPGPGQRIGVSPWTPIWYRAVLEDRRAAIRKMVEPHAKDIAGVFLNQVQGAPSACGCGNTQCRWTVDYRMPGGPEKIEGSPSTLLVEGLKKDLPGVEWIPVLVPECEKIDQDDQAEHSTGLCGTVHCFDGLCWKESTKELEPLFKEVTGPLALLLGEDSFSRENRADLIAIGGPSSYGPGGWPRNAVRLFAGMFEKEGRAPVSSQRLLAVLEGHDTDAAERRRLLSEVAPLLGVRGVVISAGRFDEDWEPKLIPAAAKP